MKRCLLLLTALLMGCTMTGNVILEPKPDVYFCPKDNCGQALYDTIASSKESVHCAVYDLNLEGIISILDQKSRFVDVKVIVDKDNYFDALNKSFVKTDTRSAFMHNKFCIIDNKIVTTGSFNPTYNDNDKNNNNLVIFKSPELARNYEDEFNEMWNGKFGRGEKTANPVLIFNTTKIENYFCPEDWCTNKVLEALSLANKSIYFMTFSFTSDPIGDYLVKRHSEGIEIKGIFEKQQESDYSEYEKLKNAGMNVTLDTNPYKMHHKVFIIDESIVITGSFNPSKNAEESNDENILIIYNKDMAQKFIEEFNRLY